MTTAGSLEQRMSSGDLIAELSASAINEGPNVGLWPGLTTYRFTEPVKPQWDEIRSLSLGIVAQGRKAVMVDGKRYVYDQFQYLVTSGALKFECEIEEASPDAPCLCLVLEIEPALVRRVSAEMRQHRQAESPEKCVVSALDAELLSSLLRFLGSLSEGADRRVLAPLYLQEMVYRVMQRDQFARVLQIAAQQTAGNPVAAALNYISAHLAEPLTVDLLAAQVNLSPSAFSRLFRDITSRSPYQFVKEMRLNRARELVVEGQLAVVDVSRAVGYSSPSHFIKEFRNRFGSTPRDYGESQLLGGR